jgi:hypothetical protein
MGYTLEEVQGLEKVQRTQPEPVALKDMPPPPGAPLGGEMVEVDYCGPTTWMIASVLSCIGAPWCVCLCPCDRITVYRAPDGTLYNLFGAVTKPCCVGGCCGKK